MQRRLLFLLSFLLFAAPAFAQKSIDEKVDSVLELMTLEEKIGQMTLFTTDWAVTGPTIREGYEEDVRSGRVGALFNAHTTDFTRKLQEIAVEETRLGIPLLFGYDVIHGYKTIFPIPLAEAASWDLEAIEQSARIAAEEATAAGLHWTFAPMVDIARDPRWGRIAEGAGEDVYLASEIAKARVRGFQGDDIGATNTMLACAKHFAAYGAAQAGRDYHTVDISELALREIYLPPFEAALEEDVYTFMTSFNEIFGIPATGSEFLLTDILREEWEFDGFVVTDYTSINEMIPHGVAADEAAAGNLAVQAGVDMDMQGAVFHNHLQKLVEEGHVSESRIDRSVRRILRQKFMLGLFDDPYRYSDAEREKATVLAEAHLEAARDVARKSIVLLKNENQILPLSKDIETLALIGPLADSQQELLGSWFASGDVQDAVTLRTGIRQKVSEETTLLYAKGADIEGNATEGFDEAVLAAMQADAVVVAVGEKGLMSGEAASRSELDLPGVQKELVLRLVATGTPVVVVLMNGRPLAIPEITAQAPAMLETWFLGTQAGPTIADVLFGDYNPSGKLPVTFPRNVGQVPIFYSMKNTGRPFDADNKYTSKYLDVPNEPLFPFVFGLSYTAFDYSVLSVDKPRFSMDESIEVAVTVQNIGEVEGTETVQLYIRDLVASITRPVKELKAFQQVTLASGELQALTFTLTAEDLKFYNSDLEYVAEPGQFEIFVGTNSADTQSLKVELTK